MTNAEDAHRYRWLLAAGMLVLFSRANGREAASPDELAAFLSGLPDKFDLSLLTEDELKEAERRCSHMNIRVFYQQGGS